MGSGAYTAVPGPGERWRLRKGLALAGRDFFGIQEGARAAKPAADPLDGVFRLLGPHPVEVRATVAVLRDPLACEAAVPDAGQEPLHCPAGLFAHDLWTGSVVAVLRRVGNGVTHVVEPALVEEIDDQ